MKLSALLIIFIFAVTGCSSSSDDQSTLDGGTLPDSNTMPDVDPMSDDNTAIDGNAIIDAALTVINTDHLERAMDQIIFPIEQNSFIFTGNDANNAQTFACPTSGTASHTLEPYPTTTYNDCVVSGITFNGNYRQAAALGIVIANFDNFTILENDGLLTIQSGNFSYVERADPERTSDWRWDDTVYSYDSMAGSLSATITSVLMQKTNIDAYRASFEAVVNLDGVA